MKALARSVGPSPVKALGAAAVLTLSAWASPGAEAAAVALQACRLPGLPNEAQCGRIERPLDPAQPAGRRIEVHFAVLPALARNKKPDPVFAFAGGPGQSAIDLAGVFARTLARLANRRDIVLVDQRGTGRSAPLACPELAPTAPLAESADPVRQRERLSACRQVLEALPHGDLRRYTTTVAMQDVDAVRAVLGAERINLVGASYGTRAALEYLRQFPGAVRRAALDGVAPPDMALPAAFALDSQAALDAVWAACEAAPACRGRHPAVRSSWKELLQKPPFGVEVRHPVTGVAEHLTMSRDLLLGLIRAPLYVPALASALPAAVSEAAGAGRWEPLFGLAASLQGARPPRLYEGMHFSVICSEDLAAGGGAATGAAAAAAVAGAGAGGPAGGVAEVVRPPQPSPAPDFGDSLGVQYQRVCEAWQRGPVPEAFYRVPPAPAPVLLLSGGTDPATPPRHGARTASALGARARHVVVPEAGHGLMTLPCLRDVLFRFIDADGDDAAQGVALAQADCAAGIPRPASFVPVQAPGAAR